VSDKIKKGNRVRHSSGWLGTVVKIEGRMMGNRILFVRPDKKLHRSHKDGEVAEWLECVFEKIAETGE
jgi:hypothetical protein